MFSKYVRHSRAVEKSDETHLANGFAVIAARELNDWSTYVRTSFPYILRAINHNIEAKARFSFFLSMYYCLSHHHCFLDDLCQTKKNSAPVCGYSLAISHAVGDSVGSCERQNFDRVTACGTGAAAHSAEFGRNQNRSTFRSGFRAKSCSSHRFKMWSV